MEIYVWPDGFSSKVDRTGTSEDLNHGWSLKFYSLSLRSQRISVISAFLFEVKRILTQRAQRYAESAAVRRDAELLFFTHQPAD